LPLFISLASTETGPQKSTNFIKFNKRSLQVRNTGSSTAFFHTPASLAAWTIIRTASAILCFARHPSFSPALEASPFPIMISVGRNKSLVNRRVFTPVEPHRFESCRNEVLQFSSLPCGDDEDRLVILVEASDRWLPRIREPAPGPLNVNVTKWKFALLPFGNPASGPDNLLGNEPFGTQR
jgi:hypothetical protein